MDGDRVVAGPRSTIGRAWVLRIAGIATSIVALVVVFGSVDASAAWAVVLRASSPVLVIALGLVAVQVVVRGWRWRIVLPERLDGQPVAVSRTINPLLVGYLGNAVLPARLGEPIRALLVSRREGLDVLTAFGATMLERFIDTLTLALIALAAALGVGTASWIVAVGGVVGIAGLIGLGLLVAVGMTRLTDLAAALLGRLGLAGRTRRLLGWARSFADGVDRGRDAVRLSKVLALSIVAWVLDASIFWLVGSSLGLGLGFADAVLIGAVSVLATAIPAAPGYVGTFELAATATAVALGVPRPEALALAVLVHVITLVPLAVAGALAVTSSGVRLSGLAAQVEEVEHGAV